jgi:DNA-binding Lrp family transcriptional regulator
LGAETWNALRCSFRYAANKSGDIHALGISGCETARFSGAGSAAFTLVRFGVHDRQLADRFEREIPAIPRIVSCHNISGGADYLLQVVARDLEDYGTFLRDVLRKLPDVMAVESTLSLREVKRDAGLPLL